MISLKTDAWRIDDIETVLFDKDGTIIDSHLYWGRIIERRAKALLLAYSLPCDYFAELCRVMGYSNSLKKLLPEGPIALVGREEVIDIINVYLTKNNIKSNIKQISDIFLIEHELFAKELFDYIEILPGITDLLIKLKNNGIKTAVVTSDSVANTEIILAHLQINNYFDVIIGKESTTASKITGIPVFKALEYLHADSHGAVCIGDAPVDIIMALQSGCKAGVGVTTGQVPSEELLKHSLYVTSSIERIEIC